MRTTLDIDEDVLFAAKELAAREKKTTGKILSDFFRRALHTPNNTPPSRTKAEGAKFIMKNGFPVLPAEGRLVTTEMIHRLMEQ